MFFVIISRRISPHVYIHIFFKSDFLSGPGENERLALGCAYKGQPAWVHPIQGAKCSPCYPLKRWHIIIIIIIIKILEILEKYLKKISILKSPWIRHFLVKYPWKVLEKNFWLKSKFFSVIFQYLKKKFSPAARLNITSYLYFTFYTR